MKTIFALGLAAGVVLGASVAAIGQDAKPSSVALMKTMETMMSKMHAHMTGDADKDFAVMMIPHHQGAIDMAKVELEYGKDPELRDLARKIIDAQESEIKFLNDWLVRQQADDHH
jgi:uncharacterized protein (DUF305 family)